MSERNISETSNSELIGSLHFRLCNINSRGITGAEDTLDALLNPEKTLTNTWDHTTREEVRECLQEFTRRAIVSAVEYYGEDILPQPDHLGK